MTEPAVFDVIDIMTGYQQSAALAAAVQLGVFDELAERPLDAEELASALGATPLGIRALLDSLVGLSVLSRHDGIYHAGPVASRLRASGDLRLVAEKEAFFARVWLDLAESIRTGRPQLDPWQARIRSDPDQAKRFLRALVVLADQTGPDLAQLPGFVAGAKIADLGGGLGSYAVPLAAAGGNVTLFDLPQVISWAKAEISVSSSFEPPSDRLSFIACDLLASPLNPEIDDEYDIVLLSHLLHDLDDEDAVRVLRVARQICAPSGQVAVFELPGDPPGSFGPLFDLMMQVETRGRARRVDELAGLMQEAGLQDVSLVKKFARPHAVLIAHC